MTYQLRGFDWGKEEIDAIHRVIASDRYTMARTCAPGGEFAGLSRRSSRRHGEFGVPPPTSWACRAIP